MLTRVVRTAIVGIVGGVILWHLGGCDLAEKMGYDPCAGCACECAEVSEWQELVGDIEDLIASIDE